LNKEIIDVLIQKQTKASYKINKGCNTLLKKPTANNISYEDKEIRSLSLEAELKLDFMINSIRNQRKRNRVKNKTILKLIIAFFCHNNNLSWSN
jgi:hypothetical protein